MRKVLLFAMLTLSTVALRAQEDPEYRMEIGAGTGLMTYLGDLNGNLTVNPQAMGALVAKYRKNPRMAWALNVGLGKVKGDSGNEKTWYPGVSDSAAVSFSHTLADFGVRYEYNFWPYGTGREYRGAQRLTPFVALGFGITYANPGKTVVTANVPLGLGVKYKAGDRLNLTAEWMMHFSGSDELDGMKDPYGIRSSGLFKNTDCYTTLQLSLTYDIWAKCKTCHNDRD